MGRRLKPTELTEIFCEFAVIANADVAGRDELKPGSMKFQLAGSEAEASLVLISVSSRTVGERIRNP